VAERNVGRVAYRLEMEQAEHDRLAGVALRHGCTLDDLVRQALELVLLVDRGVLFDDSGRELRIGRGRHTTRVVR
jgi:hypothetical protein